MNAATAKGAAQASACRNVTGPVQPLGAGATQVVSPAQVTGTPPVPALPAAPAAPPPPTLPVPPPPTLPLPPVLPPSCPPVPVPAAPPEPAVNSLPPHPTTINAHAAAAA